MSTIKVDTIQKANGTSQIGIDKIGGVTAAATVNVIAEGGTNTTNLSQGLAKAWIKLDMNAQANDDSFNVASITDNALGDFTVTISTDMNNVNYSITGMASRLANSTAFHVVMTHETTAPAAGLYRLRCSDVAGNDKDGQHVMTAVHGDLA